MSRTCALVTEQHWKQADLGSIPMNAAAKKARQRALKILQSGPKPIKRRPWRRTPEINTVAIEKYLRRLKQLDAVEAAQDRSEREHQRLLRPFSNTPLELLRNKSEARQLVRAPPRKPLRRPPPSSAPKKPRPAPRTTKRPRALRVATWVLNMLDSEKPPTRDCRRPIRRVHLKHVANDCTARRVSEGICANNARVT